MATNILTPTQYRLSKADREVIIAGIPLEIQYPLGVVPDLVLQKNSEYFPALRGRTNMSQLEMAQTYERRSPASRTIFVQKHGDIFG